MTFLTRHAGRVGRLVRKELSESLRDRRTILTLVLMPILLYPLLAITFQQLMLSARTDRVRTEYRIAFASEEDANGVIRYWNIGREELLRHQGDQPGGIPGEGEGQKPSLKFWVSENLVEDVRLGRYDVAVLVKPPGDFAPDPSRPLFVDCELIYRDDSPIGKEAVRYLALVTAGANVRMISSGLALMKVRQRGDPLRVTTLPVTDDSPKKNPLLPVLIPLILILMTITGAVYPAIDLTAGERERGTLEILVAAPIPRLSVLFAKYVAVLTVAMLTALVNLGAMTITLYASPIGKAVFGAALTPLVLVEVLALLLLFAAFFSAVLLAITSFARSFKEAQAYLIPLMLLALTPGVLGLLPGLTIDGPLAVVPLLNVVLLARDIFEGTASWSAATVVVLTTLLYAASAIAVAARIFGTEAVLSEQSGWGDFLARPRQSSAAATPSAALLCLALLFPASFMISSGFGHLSGLTPTEKVQVQIGATLLLFGGIPLVSAWSGNVRLVEGFQLPAPPVAGVVCGLLLGLGLWPFVLELGLLQQRAGFESMSPEVKKQIGEMLAGWRELSPVLIVFAMAVVPATLEELFFRGYLMTAFRGAGWTSRSVVLLTAGLFSLFHLLVKDSLAIERLPISFLLGVVLGTLAWKTGSIWPGVALHITHNAIIAMLGYYQPWLEANGWVAKDLAHLPSFVLVGAGVLSGVGLLGLWLMRPRQRTGSA